MVDDNPGTSSFRWIGTLPTERPIVARVILGFADILNGIGPRGAAELLVEAPLRYGDELKIDGPTPEAAAIWIDWMTPMLRRLVDGLPALPPEDEQALRSLADTESHTDG